jgi:2,3-dihydroxyphenylpropionate 1,2-dioxygenase
MSTIVRGVMASHTTLMNTKWDAVDHLPGAHQFRDGLAAAKQSLIDADVDVVIVIGPNHFRGFWLDLMPTFTIGVAEVIGAGEHGTPSGHLPSDAPLARHLVEQLHAHDFDPTFSLRLTVDHGITHAVQYLVPNGTPIVPVVINSFAPPLPSLARCAALGEAIAVAVASDGEDCRVAVIGSGGLSHTLPFPDWRSPKSDDDDFLVQSWLDGRNDWASFETRRRGIVLAAPSAINESFDESVLVTLAAGDGKTLLKHQDNLVRTAGNGANELRNWIAAAAVCGWAPSRTIAYSAMPKWLTGMAVAVVETPQTLGGTL